MGYIKDWPKGAKIEGIVCFGGQWYALRRVPVDALTAMYPVFDMSVIHDYEGKEGQFETYSWGQGRTGYIAPESN